MEWEETLLGQRGWGLQVMVVVGCPWDLPSICPGSLQASGERLHAEPGPGPLGPACPMYQYQYSPPMAPPMYHGYEEWQQIRYPPAMPGEHTQGQNFHHFPPVRLHLCQQEGEQRVTCGQVWGSLPSRASESQSRELSSYVLVACDCSAPFLPFLLFTHYQSVRVLPDDSCHGR